MNQWKLQKSTKTNKQTNKQTTKKRTLYDYVERHEEAYRNNEIKSLVDFAEEYSSSIK